MADFDVFDDVQATLDDGRRVRGNMTAIDGRRLRMSVYGKSDEYLVDPADAWHL